MLIENCEWFFSISTKRIGLTLLVLLYVSQTSGGYSESYSDTGDWKLTTGDKKEVALGKLFDKNNV